MNRSAFSGARWSFLFAFFVLGLIAAIAILPSQFRSQAGPQKTGEGLFTRTVTHGDDLPNYDIRSDKAAADKIAAFRSTASKDAAGIADIRDSFAKGEQALKTRVPSLKVEYNSDIKTPEVISPDVQMGREFLTSASGSKRSDILLNFLKQNNELIGSTENQINGLKVFSDYTNPDGNLSFVELTQEINGIPVFRGEVKAGFTKNGEIIRVINNFAPGLSYESLSTDFRQPGDAVRSAASYINHNLKADETSPNSAASNNLKTVYGQGDWATTAEKMYFPTEPGVAVPAWRVMFWLPVNAFYVIVDAETGAMLWRKNLGEDQSQSATYQVYSNPNAMINVADSAAPLSPGSVDPASGVQGAITSRTNVIRFGNEAPYTFNNNGWITDGGNTTDGNNLESGLDIDGVNGVDAGSPVTGSPARVFSSAWNPPPGNPAPGDAPTAVEARRGAIIQQFYIMNWYHDELYRLGFTESARNFQQDNFGRGGVGGDRVSGEGQDSSGTNNANFNAGADGTRGRMQMYVWTGPNPDRDGTGDADIMIHEVTHGTSNRLHGNNAGLTLNNSRAMGEGWSDFYAHALLSEPGDTINGTYTLSGYTLFQAFGVVGTQNYYYGIRRFPKAVMASTGGPNNRPHNPMTFADIDQSTANTTNGAYPAMAGPHIATAADQVHAAGEVWSNALWEIRARMVQRLGWAAGNRLVLQLVTDGMKLAPLGPTFLTERDAIVAAALATGNGADVADVWAGFAIRGMGAGASMQNVGTGTGNARVTEDFGLPNLTQSPALTVSDSTGDNDGFFEPGEPVLLTLPLKNSTGNTATGVTVQVVGGGSANYGTINHLASASQPIPFTVPVGTGCGNVLSVVFNMTSSLGPVSLTRTILIGAPAGLTSSENFDSVTAPALPVGWTAVPVGGGPNFVTSTIGPDTAPNSAFALNPATIGGGTDLTGPRVTVTSAAATVSFRNKFDTEALWDGGVLEISIAEGPFQDILAAGGTFTANGYTGLLGGGANNPLAGRSAWTGNSAGYVTTTAQLPASANGKIVQLRWRMGSDDNTVGTGPNPGWNVDGITLTGASFIGSYACSYNPSTLKSRADFDGDGKSDLSVYRPSEGNWYVLRSTAGFNITSWGLASDIVAPGDFDGDGKADFSVFRPSEGVWYIANSNGTFTGGQFGLPGDIPVPADYDGDGKDDRAVFRPSNSTWYIVRSTGGVTTQAFGLSGDRPVPGDYDGDLKADLSVFRPSNGTWYRANSGNGNFVVQQWGLSGDIPVNADYDGDNKQDFAVFRPSSASWYILNSSNGSYNFRSFGLTGDVPVPGDYDGNGSDDIAVFRNGFWYIIRSAQVYTTTQFGLAGDTAIPAK